MELETVLQKTETLLCDRSQQVSPDDQLENEHRLVMDASLNIVSLALENHMVDQMLAFYFNAMTTSFVQYTVDLTQPLHPNQFTLRLEKYTYHTHPIFAMAFFWGDLGL